MTLILALKTRDAVFLAADSALTRPGLRSQKASSFGEPPRERGGHVVEEALFKLHRLDSRTVAGYASSVGPATAFLSRLRNGIDSADLREAVESALYETHQCEPGHFRVLMGRMDQSGPRLFRIDSGPPHSMVELTDAIAADAIGSGAEPLRPNLEVIVSDAVKLRGNSAAKLMAILTQLQLHGQHEQLFAHHVGGTFHGAWVDADGFHWQPDTVYALYSRQAFTAVPGQPLGHIEYMNALVRGDVLAVHSSITKETRLFATVIDFEQWKKSWDVEVRRVIDANVAEFYVMMSREARVGAVFQAGSTEFKVHCDASSDLLQFAFSPTAMARLLFVPEGEKPMVSMFYP